MTPHPISAYEAAIEYYEAKAAKNTPTEEEKTYLLNQQEADNAFILAIKGNKVAWQALSNDTSIRQKLKTCTRCQRAISTLKALEERVSANTEIH